MVKLDLIVEGGTSPSNDVSAQTANNSEALREAFHKFFTRLLQREDIEITIYMGGGFRNAAKNFVRQPLPFGLFVDSDLPPTEKHKWFNKLINTENAEKNIVIPNARKEYVFFMIQEMEAWFLKQPACMDRWAQAESYSRNPKVELSSIAEHSLLRKSIEYIAKPSNVMEQLIRHFFVKNGKKAKYGKLRTAPALLDALDVSVLIHEDEELKRFMHLIAQSH